MALADGQLWVYDSVAGKWQNKDIGAVDGDQLEITWDPTNYVPDASPSEADDVNDLTAHLKGIDTGILATYTAPIEFSDYIETNARITEHHLHGDLETLATAQSINSGGGFSVVPGISRVMLVVLAGTDTAGDITLTGTSVDRDDGSETGADTDVITIDGLSTDGSDTDAAGNVRHSFTKAYISSKWFRGSVALTTADVDLTDVDVYAITFDQFNDEAEVVIDTFDITLTIVTGAADFFGYLYSVINTGTDTWDITREASVGDVTANLSVNDYRFRRSSLALSLDGTADGFFMVMFPSTVNRFEDITVKLWADVTRTVILGV